MGVRENLEKAIEIVSARPEEWFNLTYDCINVGCGERYNIVGLLATHKFFTDQGMRLTKETHPSYGLSSVVCGDDLGYLGYATWTDRMFGKDSFNRLFRAHNLGLWDNDMDDASYAANDRALTDKELALSRLNKQLVELPQGEQS